MRRSTLIPLFALGACELIDPGAVDPEDFAQDGICDVVPEAGPGDCGPVDSPIPYAMLGPNVHLVVDRSASMDKESRWLELQALVAFLPMVGERANLGLTLFPGPELGQCGVATVPEVPLSDGAVGAADIEGVLLDTRPGGWTPIADALDQIAGSPGLSCGNRDNVVVLLSDGEETCGGNPEASVRRLTQQGEVPVELYVIGFGTDAATNEKLAGIARAAAETTGSDNFYTADTAEELVQRLAAVTSTCTAQLQEDVGKAELAVTLDGRALEQCTAERCERGFTVDRVHGNLTLEGEDCLATLDQECHELLVDYAL